MMGRGWGAVDKITRRLDGGVLPILEGTLVDDDLTYELTAFVTLESTPLTAQNVQGTHYLVADGHGIGHMFTKEQQAQYDSLLPGEMNKAGGDRALHAGRCRQYGFRPPLCLSPNRVTQPRLVP